MGKYIFWLVLTALVTGCSGGSGEHDGEDGRTSATRVENGSSAAQHSSVVPGTCATCHGTTAEGKDSKHIPTTASCDVCHQTSGWEPARINHSNVAPGTCATCHNGTSARGKKSSHVATTASCDVCHQTTGWKPATMGHSNAAPGTCATCHNSTTAGGKSSNHVATAASCDTCHLTTAWIPATASHGSVAPSAGTCATCHNGTTARGKSSMHISTTASCDTCHLTTAWIPSTMATSTIDFPVEAVFASMASTASTYTATATDAAGNSFLLSVDRVPGPDKTDPLIYAVPLKTYSQSNTISKNGVVTSTNTKNFEDFYSVAPFYLFGSLNNMFGSSNNMKVTTQLPLPATSQVGASGVLYKGRNYINKVTTSFDTWYAMWSLEADSATTAWLCLNVEITPANATAVSTAENDCFRINQAGNITGFKADITVNGITLSYR